MRRTLITAALAFLLAVPVYAQHRGFGSTPRMSGGHVGVRHHGGFGFRGGFGVRGGVAFGHNPRFRVFFGSNGFRHHRFFRGFPLGYGYYPYYPYSMYPYYTAYPYYGLGLQSDLVYSGPTQQPSSDYNAEQTAALSNQVSQLQAELDQLRQERAVREEQQYANRVANAPRSEPAPARDEEPPAPPTILVFRDGRRAEARNYAVAGRTLWIFSEQRARKVPLADLDLDATRKANEERGVEFAVRGNSGVR